jgi:hypothetical protein
VRSVRFASRIPSCLRVLAAAAALWGIAGCKSETKPADTGVSKIVAGMTVEEVDKLVGASGTEMAFADLPAIYRTLLEKPPGGTEPVKGAGIAYRKWTRTIGTTSANSYAAFREGRVVDGTVYLETFRSGQ